MKSIIEGARVGTWEWNVQTGETVFNDNWADFVGYTLAELAPVSIETWNKLAHPDDLELSNQKLEDHFSGKSPWYDCRCRMRHKDGRWIWVHDRGKVITRTANGQPLMMFGTHMDITEVMHAEQALRANETKYKALFEQSLQGVYLHDLEGRIIDVNDMACIQSRFTREELLERNIFDSHPTTADTPNLPRKEIIRQWKQWPLGKRMVVEAVHQRKDGTLYAAEISTGSVHFNDSTFMLAIVQDVTERKKATENLIKLQKLESLGLLAGGIAHDFNNLMSGVFGNIDLAVEANSQPEVANFLNRALRSMSRAQSLTRQLLTFSKGGDPVKKTQPLEPVVRDATTFALSGSGVSHHFLLPPDLWQCSFDANQISQVIDNIVINARQAMPGGGTVTISAENRHVDSEPHGLEPGQYVCLSIADRGSGIPREIISKIFDPFYTTKSTGQGLGLATSFSIVKRHGGIIEAESPPGEGATFKIYLPAVDETDNSQYLKQNSNHQGNGRILVMDDESLIRDIVRAMLESFGYEIIEAERGEDAVNIILEDAREGRFFRALILDLTVPGGMGGKKALAQLRKHGITTPAFVCSGYSDDPVIVRPQEFGFSASLCKPFRKQDLAAVLKQHLGDEV